MSSKPGERDDLQIQTYHRFGNYVKEKLKINITFKKINSNQVMKTFFKLQIYGGETYLRQSATNRLIDIAIMVDQVE